MSNETVISIEEFKKKYGVRGFGLEALVKEFIARAPEFPGDKDLAAMIGEAMADLESALVDHQSPKGKSLEDLSKDMLNFALKRINRVMDLPESTAEDIHEYRYERVFEIYSATIKPAIHSLSWVFDWYDPDTSYEEDTNAFVRAFRDFCEEKGIKE